MTANKIVPLKSVTIENFRGIRRATLELHPHVTVLFGSNAAGKTSVLDAIAIGLGKIVDRFPKVAGRDFAKEGDIRVPWLTRSGNDPEDPFSEKRTVKCPYARVEICTLEGTRWDTIKWRSIQDKKTGIAVGTKALNAQVDPLVKEVLDSPTISSGVGNGDGTGYGSGWGSGAGDGAGSGGAFGPIPLFACYGTERSVVEIPLRERGFNKEFPRQGAFEQSLRATTRFKTVFEWFRVMEDEERRERERLQDLTYPLPELEWVRRAVENAELRCKNPRVMTRPVRMLVDYVHTGSGDLGDDVVGVDRKEPLDVTALSDGFRTHFSLVVDVARRMVQLNPSNNLSDQTRGTYSPAVILIDEIDLHLDPQWQGRVVKGLRKAFPNAQFILTTHSEQVIGSVERECVRNLVWREGEIGIQNVPFAQGASGERILVDLMGAPVRVEGEVTKKLKQYTRLVGMGQGATEEGIILRKELEQALRDDPDLAHLDLEMQRQALMQKLQVMKGNP